MKRTRQDGVESLEDVQDLDQLVVDKRSSWRANSAKGRRRNRRYENRILSHADVAEYEDLAVLDEL
ncbi:hypothetical protein IQ266_10040 [filamentous cyanobacterium LEGE 11480]|uniref:Uncharacterized protein n=1 Tax=Romeriopsis navalis LEGE 11480 TaxID=2777977 RepID=A0A928VPB3_9CYAN|nr:hypothetical protein [Romeriopsis navalis]MBE9030067.1 hypothetical protein [Romeriopsis navalis LEGE 11480]